MKALLLSAALFACQPAFAGGVVIIPEETEVADENAHSFKDAVPLIILGLVVLCAIACGGGEDNPAEPPKGCLNDGGCQ